MRIVVISQRVDEFPERNEKRDALDQRLTVFITACGYVPIPIPNTLGNSLREWLSVLKPVAVVLSGGNDIGQCKDRDKTEFDLLAYAHEYKLPLLGICRGMQIMAYWSGAKLHQVSGHTQKRHKLTGQISIEVNSYHNYSLNDCPAGFKVLARSEDGEIEAIRSLSLAWEGWMWHPEREVVFATDDIERLKELFK